MRRNPHSPDHPEVANRRKETWRYIAGYALALLLTAAAFVIAGTQVVAKPVALPVLAGLALAQMVVHFRHFLHIDLARSHRDDLQLILFTALIVLMMVGGTIWILWDQHSRMM